MKIWKNQVIFVVRQAQAGIVCKILAFLAFLEIPKGFQRFFNILGPASIQTLFNYRMAILDLFEIPNGFQ